MSETPKKTAAAAADKADDKKVEAPKPAAPEAPKAPAKEDTKPANKSDEDGDADGEDKDVEDRTVFDAPGVQKPASVAAFEKKSEEGNKKDRVPELRRQDIAQIYTH